MIRETTTMQLRQNRPPLASREVKEIAIQLGAEECGIARIERFSGAPRGFHPADIYQECRSVAVLLKSMPGEIIMANNPIPYTHAAYLMYAELDRIGMSMCRAPWRREAPARCLSLPTRRTCTGMPNEVRGWEPSPCATQHGCPAWASSGETRCSFTLNGATWST